MLVSIDPIILSFGPLGVRWFGALALVGLGLAVWLSWRALRAAQLGSAVVLDALAWALPAGVIAARVAYVLGWWDYYLTHVDEISQFGVEGLSVWGGLLGGGLIALARLRSRRSPERPKLVLDAVVPYVALGLAIAQLGAFLDGHGQGLPSDLPWATRYASALAATPDFGVARHPVQVYEALIDLGLFLSLRAVPRRWPAGSRVAGFLIVGGGARLALGPLRLDPPFLFGLQLEQLLALVAIGGGLVLLVRPRLPRATRASGAQTIDRESETVVGRPRAAARKGTVAAGGEGTMAAGGEGTIAAGGEGTMAA